MDMNNLLQKKVSRKDFIKYIGFFILAVLLFPRKALNFVNENNSSIKSSETNEIKIDGIKVMEIVDR